MSAVICFVYILPSPSFSLQVPIKKLCYTHRSEIYNRSHSQIKYTVFCLSTTTPFKFYKNYRTKVFTFLQYYLDICLSNLSLPTQMSTWFVNDTKKYLQCSERVSIFLHHVEKQEQKIFCFLLQFYTQILPRKR